MENSNMQIIREDEINEFNTLWNNTNPHVTVYSYTTSAQTKIL